MGDVKRAQVLVCRVAGQLRRPVTIFPRERFAQREIQPILIFRDFINATAHVFIDERDVITVRSQKRAHNLLLIAPGWAKNNLPVPWLQNKKLQLIFG